jgi:hypothetical protein
VIEIIGAKAVVAGLYVPEAKIEFDVLQHYDNAHELTSADRPCQRAAPDVGGRGLESSALVANHGGG